MTEMAAPDGADRAMSGSGVEALGSAATRTIAALANAGSATRADVRLARPVSPSPGERDEELLAARHRLSSEAAASSVERASTDGAAESLLPRVAGSDEVPTQSPPTMQSRALERGSSDDAGAVDGAENTRTASVEGSAARRENSPAPELNGISANSTDLQGSQENSGVENATSSSPADPELLRLRALHVARKSARRRPPSGINNAAERGSSIGPGSTGSTRSYSVDYFDGDSAVGDTGEELRRLRAAHQVELQSIRRNHIENLKKVMEERDMFAAQLAEEQANGRTPASARKQIADLNAQLRAARIRTADMQEELARLQSENKQLYFRVQANKTLHAEADSYSKVVDDLVSVKIKCAQLEEEKEEYRRASREVASSIAILTEANGDLERSRADWVVQCADLQRQKDELEKQLTDLRQSKAGSLDSKAKELPSAKRGSLVTSPNSSLSGVQLD